MDVSTGYTWYMLQMSGLLDAEMRFSVPIVLPKNDVSASYWV